MEDHLRKKELNFWYFSSPELIKKKKAALVLDGLEGGFRVLFLLEIGSWSLSDLSGSHSTTEPKSGPFRWTTMRKKYMEVNGEG